MESAIETETKCNTSLRVHWDSVCRRDNSLVIKRARYQLYVVFVYILHWDICNCPREIVLACEEGIEGLGLVGIVLCHARRVL